MTNTEALQSIIAGNINISTDELNNYLILKGVNPNDTYDSANNCKLYGYALYLISSNNQRGITSISEGGYSISYDKSMLASVLSNIASDSGCEDLINKYGTTIIEDKSDLW